MMQNGTRPAKHIYKVQLYQHFGAVSPDVPDFDLSAGFPIRNQEADNAPFECVGYTGAHILASIVKDSFSPDFSYAAARYVAGDGKEGTQGTSFHAGMDALVAFGGLIQSLTTSTASALGEQMVSDWNIWNDGEKRSALRNAQNGNRNVLGMGDSFDSILSALSQSRIPISVGSPWFREWGDAITGNGQPKTAILPVPDTSVQFSLWHNYAISGKKTIDGIPYLIVYSHQGDQIGDSGKLYVSRETINKAMTVQGSGALTIDPSAIRWVSLVGILVRRFPALLPYLPQLLKLHP